MKKKNHPHCRNCSKIQ